MTRTNRWKRAFALGLEPPIEVLAVLLRAEQGTKKRDSGGAPVVAAKTMKGRVGEVSIVDELMASRVGTGLEA